MGRGHVSGIFIYPIKSCRSVSVESAIVSAIGHSGDRLWQVVGGEGRGTTQRKHQLLATVQPTPTEAGGLQIDAPGMPTLLVEPPSEFSIESGSHFREPVAVSDAGAEAAGWFTRLTGESVRLVAHGRRIWMAPPWRSGHLPPECTVFRRRFSPGDNIIIGGMAPRSSH